MRLACVLALAAVSIGACQKAGETAVDRGASARGRYVGVGIYMAGDLWRHIARPANAAQPDPALATLADDEQVIVVLDSVTGELRQCGNLSGHCLTLDPWSKAASVQAAPTALLKHARDLQREAHTEPARPPAQK